MSSAGDEKSLRIRLAECAPCRCCKWICGACTVVIDGWCENMRTCCCCPCWSHFFYTTLLGGGAIVYASLALLDESIAADADVQRGCRLVALSGVIHVLASIYIMVRLHRGLKEYGRMQDYMRGLDSTIIQETVVGEMWRVLMRDWIFKFYVLVAVGSYVHAIAFAGRGALEDVESTLPQNAVFCLVLHMILSFSLACCFKSAIACGIFCETVSSLLLPQAPPRRTLAAPVEVTENELSGSLVVEGAEAPAQAEKPGQESKEVQDGQEGQRDIEEGELWQSLQDEQRAQRESKEAAEMLQKLQAEQRAKQDTETR